MQCVAVATHGVYAAAWSRPYGVGLGVEASKSRVANLPSPFARAQPQAGSRRRFASAVGGFADSLPVLGLMARRRTRYVRFAQLRSNSRDESDVEARCARGHKPCAPQRRRGAPPAARLRLGLRSSGGRVQAQSGSKERAMLGTGSILMS